MKVLIKVKLSPHKYKDSNGYLICQDAILARTGKQEYMRSEIYDDTDDDSVIQVDRKPEQVLSDATLASFENVPLTCEHPNEDVNPENYRDLSVGYVRDVRRGKADGKDVMLANIVITDPNCIDDVENGIRTDLSCGYNCDITEGDSPEQINIRGNHVALCEQGRAGVARIIDSSDNIDDEKVKASATPRSKQFIIFVQNGRFMGTTAPNYDGRKDPNKFIEIEANTVQEAMDKVAEETDYNLEDIEVIYNNDNEERIEDESFDDTFIQDLTDDFVLEEYNDGIEDSCIKDYEYPTPWEVWVDGEVDRSFATKREAENYAGRLEEVLMRNDPDAVVHIEYAGDDLGDLDVEDSCIKDEKTPKLNECGYAYCIVNKTFYDEYGDSTYIAWGSNTLEEAKAMKDKFEKLYNDNYVIVKNEDVESNEKETEVVEDSCVKDAAPTNHENGFSKEMLLKKIKLLKNRKKDLEKEDDSSKSNEKTENLKTAKENALNEIDKQIEETEKEVASLTDEAMDIYKKYFDKSTRESLKACDSFNKKEIDIYEFEDILADLSFEKGE